MKRAISVIVMAAVSLAGFFGLNYAAANQSAAGYNPDQIKDVVEHISGMPADTVVLTVDGQPVTAEEYLYWAGADIEMLEGHQGTGIDWEQTTPDGLSVLDFIKDTAKKTSVLYRVVQTHAEEMDCGLDKDDRAELDAFMTRLENDLGGERQLKKQLLTVGLTRDGFEAINAGPIYHRNMQETLTDKTPFTEEEMRRFIEEEEIFSAKHILFRTVDEATREPLPQEVQAEKLALAQEVLEQLEQAEDLPALFDELMHRYSEDPGLATQPDGYMFTTGDMVPEFEQGTRALKPGEISGLVKSDFGYHIILRQDPASDEMAAALGEQQGAEQAQAELDRLLREWVEGAVVEETEAYATLDIPAYYQNLGALRMEIFSAELEAMQSAQPEK